MTIKPRIFISSTSDLEDERLALNADLLPHFEPYLYERDRARGKSPEDHCQRMIDQSDVFILLLGQSYGTPIPNENRSIVEWEFDTASNRADLELLAFVRQMALFKINDVRQKQLIERVTTFRGGIWCNYYTSSQDLVVKVKDSLMQWLVEFYVAARTSQSGLNRTVTKIMLIVGGFSVSVFTIAIVLAVIKSLPVRALFTLCGVEVVFLLLCGIISQLSLRNFSNE